MVKKKKKKKAFSVLLWLCVEEAVGGFGVTLVAGI